MPLQIRALASDADKHSYDVNSLLYHEGKLYSAADDGKIKVWDENLKLISEVQAHVSTVFCLAIGDGHIYSCSNDGLIKKFTLDLNTTWNLMQEQSEIWKLVYSNGILYAGDDQGVVYSFEKDKLMARINTMEAIKGMHVEGNVLYTVRDLDLTIAEIKGNKADNAVVRKSLMGRAPICLAGDKLCVSSRSGKEIVVYENSYDLDYKKLKEIENAHEMIVNAMCGRGDDEGISLYSGGWDKKVKKWKIANEDVTLADECGVDFCVNALACGGKGQIYAAGSDGHVVRIEA